MQNTVCIVGYVFEINLVGKECGFFKKKFVKTVIENIEEVAMCSMVSYMENTRSIEVLVNKSTANYMLFN